MLCQLSNFDAFRGCSLAFRLTEFSLRKVTHEHTNPLGVSRFARKSYGKCLAWLLDAINTKGHIYTGMNPTKIFCYPFLLAYMKGPWTLIWYVAMIFLSTPLGGQGHPF